MFQLIIRIVRLPSVSSVAVLVSGTAAAQAISFGAAPLITRLYSPEAYGTQSLFLSLAGTAATIAALTYPMAIVLPRQDVDALRLIKLCLYVSLATSAIIIGVAVLFSGPILVQLNAVALSPFVYCIPVFMFFSTLRDAFSSWLVRKHAFRLTATISVWQAFIFAALKIGGGFFFPSAGVLIVITTFSVFLHAMILSVASDRSRWFGLSTLINNQKIGTAWKLAKRHRDFPTLRAPQVFLNAVSQSLPMFALYKFFGPETAGFYSVCNLALQAPIALIGLPVRQVLYPQFNEIVLNGANTPRFLMNTTLIMAALGLIPYATMMVFGPSLFEFVFGIEWRAAGEYSRWLALWYFFMFISQPAISAVPVFGLHGEFLLFEIASVVFRLAALYFSISIFRSDITAVAAFAVTCALLSASLVTYVVVASGKIRSTY